MSNAGQTVAGVLVMSKVFEKVRCGRDDFQTFGNKTSSAGCMVWKGTLVSMAGFQQAEMRARSRERELSFQVERCE